mgnify:CR=1 FL=1
MFLRTSFAQSLQIFVEKLMVGCAKLIFFVEKVWENFRPKRGVTLPPLR